MDDDASYPIRLAVDEQVSGRNRLTTFFRIILVIPHAIIIGILQYVFFVVLVIAWFAALFTGAVPEGLHNFMVGYQRWNIRYNAYFTLLVDDYPPFGFN